MYEQEQETRDWLTIALIGLVTLALVWYFFYYSRLPKNAPVASVSTPVETVEKPIAETATEQESPS